MPLSILRDVLLIVFSAAAPVVWGVTGIFWAAPIADVLALAVTAVVMVRLWKRLEAKDSRPGAEQELDTESFAGLFKGRGEQGLCPCSCPAGHEIP